MIRIILADDHHLVRQGVRALLDKVHDIEVIGEAATGQDAFVLAEKLQPEVVVMDISMPRLDGVQATRHILSLSPPPAIVILSVHSDPILAKQLLRQGVKGYLLKKSAAEELSLAIRSAWQGELYLSPAICDPVMTTLMMSTLDDMPEDTASLLTPREQEVLQLIAEGYTNSAMAETLTVSVKTIEKHRSNLMAKLAVNDLAGLIRKSIKYGLIFLDEE